MCLATYSVTGFKKSSCWDDATYLHEYSKLIPFSYPLSELLDSVKNYWIQQKLKCQALEIWILLFFGRKWIRKF